jgi:hypothetical protein
MNGMLPALLVAAAFGIAIASERPTLRWGGIGVFFAFAEIVAFAPIPAGWNELVHLACWVMIVACGAGVHLPNVVRARVTIVLAVAAGATGGAVADAANAHATLALLPLIATAISLASRAAARRVPLAPKVASSWLIAVALLAATLQMLPITPGYLPDHLE